MPFSTIRKNVNVNEKTLVKIRLFVGALAKLVQKMLKRYVFFLFTVYTHVINGFIMFVVYYHNRWMMKTVARGNVIPLTIRTNDINSTMNEAILL